MAVDFAIPLITNVKNAKMLAEALVRNMSLDVSNVDAKTSHRTHTFPGLVNVAAFVPGLITPNSKDLAAATEAAIGAGFTTSIVLPTAVSNSIADRPSLEKARSNAFAATHCNIALGITATSSNVDSLDKELQAEVKLLFIPSSTPLSSVAAHFSSWPAEKPIVTDAKGSELASVLLLASLHNRTVHVTDVRSKDDLILISLSKARQLKVTCDVSIQSLFFTSEKYPGTTSLPSAADQKALWQNLDTIDVFSVGSTPYHLAVESGKLASSESGVEEALPLLLTAFTERRLTLDDIRIRLHDNPVQIFSIPDQTQTHVEVIIGRKTPFSKRSQCWSPLEQTSVSGSIHRVVFHGQTVFLDGSLFPAALGRDVSATPVAHPTAIPAPSVLKEDISSHANAISLTTTSAPHPPAGHHQVTPSTQILPHLQPHPSYHRRHILSVKQFTQRDLYDLFALATEIRLQVERTGTLDILKGKVLASIFYEPSTRTSSSFDAAMKRCGGQVVQVAADNSSVLKGESLPDTIRTLACYGDAIVIRHPDVGSAQLAAKYSPVPIINAGDGIGEHPTQVGLLLIFPSLTHLGFHRHCWTSIQSVRSWVLSTGVLLRSLVTSKTDERFTVW